MNNIIDGTNDDTEIKNIDAELSRRAKTPDYSRYEVDSNKGVETTCLLLQQEMHKDGKTMTVREYEVALEILRKRNEEWEKRKKR